MTMYQNGIFMSGDTIYSVRLGMDTNVPFLEFLDYLKPEPTLADINYGRGDQKCFRGTGFASPYMAGKIAKKLRKRGKR